VVERISDQLFIRIEVILRQKTCMAGATQAGASLSARYQMAVGKSFHRVAEDRRGGPVQDFRRSREQMTPRRICNFGKFIQNARPELWRE
jgi:hypothetical protein